MCWDFFDGKPAQEVTVSKFCNYIPSVVTDPAVCFYLQNMSKPTTMTFSSRPKEKRPQAQVSTVTNDLKVLLCESTSREFTKSSLGFHFASIVQQVWRRRLLYVTFSTVWFLIAHLEF